MTEEQKENLARFRVAATAREDEVEAAREEAVANLPTCQRCGSDRIFNTCSKASDLHDWEYRDRRGDGYLPYVNGVGGGDYVTVAVCLECGQCQGEFPVEPDFED